MQKSPRLNRISQERIAMSIWLKVARFCCKRLRSLEPNKRFLTLKSLASILVPEYRFKHPQMQWWTDPAFNDYLHKFGESDGMNSDRRWMLSQLLRLVADVPGDTAECGVFSGSSSHVICSANQTATQPRKHHMFDSFEGLSTPDEVDGSHWTKGDLAYGVERVKENLHEFDATAYYPGWIPDRFEDVADLQFAFVHIDVDLHQPTRDSIAFFYPRMSEGGVIVVDDYGFTSCPGATTAVDEFLADKPEKMLSLSAGGGFLIRGVHTAKKDQESVKRKAA